MQTRLAAEFQGTREGEAAEAILRKCVHCGFCTATCPTYQLLGDELDGPRGRIYLIKQVLEGEPPTRATQMHLDRCLTCRNCETTCPSGVQYGQLVDIGRAVVERKVERPLGEKLLRTALRSGLTSPLFAPAMALGKAVRPLLPAALKAKVPDGLPPGQWPPARHARRAILPRGCVQPAMLPNIDAATARVADACGVSLVPAGGCCGAIRLHLNDADGALDDMRRNVDAWATLLERGEAECIVVNASGCGVTVKDYGHALAHDAQYAARAAQVAQAARDPSEWLAGLLAGDADLRARLRARLAGRPLPKLVFHPPCTLQHGQKLRGATEALLGELGFDVRLAERDSHLCCGSAGTYSVLQPELAGELQRRKLDALAAAPDETIVSSNIGCITHLQAGSATPVRHWIETLDLALRD
jgi:glycolate oxidase iron-sulfur subunit